MNHDKVLSAVCSHYSVSPDKILTQDRGTLAEAEARRVFTYCLYTFTDLKRGQIAEIINRDDSMVTLSVAQVKKSCLENPFFREKIIQIESVIE